MVRPLDGVVGVQLAGMLRVLAEQLEMDLDLPSESSCRGVTWRLRLPGSSTSAAFFQSRSKECSSISL